MQPKLHSHNLYLQPQHANTVVGRLNLFSILLLLFLLLPQAVSAQVIIKEKVEIQPLQSPQSDNPANFDPSLCEPPVHEFVAPGDDETYSAWYGNCQEYGDCFTFIRDNVRPWNVSIVQGAEYVRVQLSPEALCENWYDPGDNFVWDDACMYIVFDEQEPDSVITVKINFSSSAGNASYTYNVYKPYFHLEQMSEIDTMDFGGEQIIELLVLNQCNNTWPSISDTTTFSAEIIKGTQYGQLWNPNTDEYGISLSSLIHSYGYLPIYFEANQTNPEQNEEIIVRVKSFNEDIDSIDVSFYVRPFNLHVTVDPPEIGPGATAQIFVQRIHSDGTLEDFPEWQTFEVGMLDGCALGMIKTESDSGAYLYDVMQPIYFKADTGAESGTVKLSVGYIRQIVSSSRNVRRDGNDLTAEKQEEQRSRKPTANQLRKPNTNNPPPTPENTESYCFIGGIASPVKKNFIIEKVDAIEITYVEGDKTINSTPEMPVILLGAKPKFPVIGPFNMDWELEAKWIDERDTPDRTTIETFNGQEAGFGNGLIIWTIPWGSKIIGGDEIKITATIVYNGFTYTTSKKLNMRIIGENPTPAVVKSGLSLFEQIIVYKESFPKWKHFNESGGLRGFPIWGSPHGYGLMQIDNPPATDEEIWNWRKNIDAAKRLIQEKKNLFADKRYERTIKKYPNANYYSDNELMMQLWQLYNSRYYFKWQPDFPKKKNSPGKWVKDNPPIAPGHLKPYAEEAWDIYNGIINGTYPPAWNN
jgi:hypothetical protein